MTLLEEAKSISVGPQKPKRTLTPDQVEVAVALAKREINGVQAAKVLDLKASMVRNAVDAMLFDGIRQGILKVEIVR